MTTLRRFTMNDLLKFNNVNLDVLTETYSITFYMQYMARWPESFTGKCRLLLRRPTSPDPHYDSHSFTLIRSQRQRLLMAVSWDTC